MADGHGGYRRPSKPAAVSGPGALSARTDGRPQPVRDLPDAEYGGNADFREIQQGSPLAAAPRATTPARGAAADPTAALTPLDAPSTQPGVPVTNGAASGAGAGIDALNLPQSDLNSELQAIGKYLPAMIRVADSPDSTPAFRAYVRRLLGGATN
jgi:hypothetical protein